MSLIVAMELQSLCEVLRQAPLFWSSMLSCLFETFGLQQSL